MAETGVEIFDQVFDFDEGESDVGGGAVLPDLEGDEAGRGEVGKHAGAGDVAAHLKGDQAFVGTGGVRTHGGDDIGFAGRQAFGAAGPERDFGDDGELAFAAAERHPPAAFGIFRGGWQDGDLGGAALDVGQSLGGVAVAAERGEGTEMFAGKGEEIGFVGAGADGDGLAALDDQGGGKEFAPDAEDGLRGHGAGVAGEKAAQDGGFAAGTDFDTGFCWFVRDVFDDAGALHEEVVEFGIDGVELRAQGCEGGSGG